MNKLLGILERGFVVVALLLFSGASVSFLGKGAASAENQVEGNPATQAVMLGIYVVVLPLLVAGWKSIVRTAMRDKLLIVLIGIVLVSVLWSAAPQITMRRSFALVFTTLFGVFLAARYSLKEQLRLLAWALGIGAVLSLLFSLASGSAEAWTGIYTQKNALGRYMAISAIVFFINARSSYRYRWIAWTGFAISVGLVLMSNSKTALVILLTLGALWPLFRALQRYYTWIVLILINAVLVSGIVGILLVDNIETLLGALGKEATLTGRTELWFVLLDIFKQQPWLGYGYRAFWLGYAGPSADVWRVVPWLPGHAHNGFLDVLVELGLLGFLVFMLGLLRGFLRAITWLHLTKTAEGLWPLLFLISLVLSNLTVDTILAQNNLFWVLYVAVILSTSVGLDYVSKSSNTDKTLGKQRSLKSA